MRLICQNCNAQYEVDASAIPAAGRDVQCSNCGNAWFQPVDGADAPPTTLAKPDPAATAKSAADADAGLDPPLLPKRRVIDESVLAVLREEAEREAIARRADAATLEMQGELGLTPSAPVGGTGAVPPNGISDLPAAAAPQPAPEPDPDARLPDLAGITSSLSPSPASGDTDAAGDDRPDPAGAGKTRSGFWTGFGLVLLLAGFCAGVYVAAPQLSARFPGAADALGAYQADVNAVRGWLDGLIGGAPAD